ncbi:hypothetical protein HYFRA_00012010 [Hymenoscyphus fraxineus]|uniref:Conserved oligomeric Golgi complex subunit 2 n=1 Tax=Hymenoscyphus fraxineus TaxID=746836 RepID=A0A9N9L2B3_9HELO|nr:hypothetical protein HYFRA_00012010 [Hymenoscyphus fraxineus]
MSKFYFGGPTDPNSSDDEDNLPYPKALPRSDFLSPNFSAPTYLSTLSNRHQTLEDLRTDLRERSQALSKELLDLVNTNYEQFLSLGSDLMGGEEKVEDVRVGLLGFKRGVEDVRGKVRERKVEVEGLLEEKKEVSREIAVGRKLLEVDGRLEELEERLMVSSLGRSVQGQDEDSWSESEEEEEEDELAQSAGVGGPSIKKLQRLVMDCVHVERLASSVGEDHPFIVAQQSRMIRVRNTILLDLNAALKTMASGEAAKSKMITMLGLYRHLGAESEAIKVLKDLKSK